MIKNQVLRGDCIQLGRKLEDESIDLIVTSPPYNVDLGNNKFRDEGYHSYKDDLPHDVYIEWLTEVFLVLKRKLKSGGRLCINIGDGKNGRVPTHVDLHWNLQRIGYLPFAFIIWDKKNVNNRTAWGSWMSPSCPSFPKPFEFIMVFSKDELKLQEKGETDIEKQDFIDWAYSHWEFPGETSKKVNHPAPFPKELPRRCIQMLSWKDATVLDPFAGSGTTLVVAEELGRDYIGFEMDEEYCRVARDRLKETKEAREAQKKIEGCGDTFADVEGGDE